MDFQNNTIVGSPNGAINYENNRPYFYPSRISGNILWDNGSIEINLKDQNITLLEYNSLEYADIQKLKKNHNIDF